MTNHISENSRSDTVAPVIEGFRILAKLGHGATSSVWKAEQVSLNRVVVIKVLAERLTHEPEDVALFKAEARLAANFKHTGIVQVYDFGQSANGQCYYFVMEYISGYSVGDWIRRKGRITEPEALVVTQAVADALKYAWDLSQIVHCDIKPDNIMVDGDGSIKVADLGLAHPVKTMVSPPGTAAKEVIITGTPNYMAPEQVRGSDALDCRADIYALGASLYHMVTGQLPFGDSPPDVVLERQLNEDFEYPQKVNPDLSTAVTRLILKMTAKEPSARFQNWNEVLAEVVPLERQMRKPDAALSERASGADLKKDAVLAGSGLVCRYCGKLMHPQAMYCEFCGKSVVAQAQTSVENLKQTTIRLRPVPESSGTRAKPLRVKSSVIGPRVATPAVQSLNALGRWYKSLGNIFRMFLTVCLLVFFGYYAYQKTKYGNDICLPLKAAVLRAVRPAFEKICLPNGWGRQWSAPWSTGALRALFKTTPIPPPKAAQKVALPPKETAASAELPESEDAVVEAVSSPLPAQAALPEATLPVANEADISDQPEALVQSATPPVDGKSLEDGKSAEPGPGAASLKSLQDVEYENILQKCKQQKPKAGDQITLRFKIGRPPLKGVVEQITAEGVKIKIPSGSIEYPFRLLAEENRLMFFPEERARRLQRQKIGKGE